METINYSQLKGQLLILQQIKNPSSYIADAINQIAKELKKLESQNAAFTRVNLATEGIEKIKSTFPDLIITYTITQPQQLITNKIKTIKSLEFKPTLNVVTHINSLNKNYTFKDPRSIIFQNKEYTGVKFWKDVLESVCNLMEQYHPDEITKILKIHGTKRLYFAQSISQISSKEAKDNPRKIKNTNIYMEHNFSANKHVEVCYMVIDLFGHKRSELNFITY